MKVNQVERSLSRYVHLFMCCRSCFVNENKVKGKEYHTNEECWWGAHLHYLGLEPVHVGGQTT